MFDRYKALRLPAQAHCRRPVAHSHFRQEVLHVLARRGTANAEGARDFLVGHASAQEAKYFHFPAR
jgi:hypothetical protein